MLKKKVVKSREVVRVTFEVRQKELPQDMEIETIKVVGEFNDWDETAVSLKYHEKDQAYRATIELKPEQTYQFRYLINGDYWCNDWAADEYTPNNLGEDNCVVVTPAMESSPAEEQTE